MPNEVDARIMRGLREVCDYATDALDHAAFPRFKCDCERCKVGIGPCSCYPKSYDEKCSGCRVAIDWALALMWLNGLLAKSSIDS